MRKISLLLFVAIISLSSCSSDSGGSSSGATVNGHRFTITDAKATDNYHFYYTTHSEFEFALSDGTIDVTAIPQSVYGFETQNASINISLSASSLGNTFQNGTYQFDENMESEPPAFSFFDDLTIYIDGNGDHDFYDPQDTILDAVSGTVTFSGTSPNFTVVFDVILSNGEHFQYTYNGGFDYVNNRAI